MAKSVFPKLHLFCADGDLRESMMRAVFLDDCLWVTDGHALVEYPLCMLGVTINTDVSFRFIPLADLKVLAGMDVAYITLDDAGIIYRDKTGVFRTLEWGGIIDWGSTQKTRMIYDNDFKEIGRYPDIKGVLPHDSVWTESDLNRASFKAYYVTNMIELRQPGQDKRDTIITPYFNKPGGITRWRINPEVWTNDIAFIHVYLMPLQNEAIDD